MRPQKNKDFRTTKPVSESQSKNIIYGRNPLIECLRAKKRKINKIYVREDLLDEARSLAKTHGQGSVHIAPARSSELETLCGGTALHQGFVAQVEPFTFCEIDDFLNLATPNIILALDGVTDPHNFGAIARSAHAFGVGGIIIPKDRSVEITPVVCKSSSGAIEHIKIAKVTNLVRTLEEFKENGFWIYGASLGEKSQPLNKIKADPKNLIVLGAEGEGLRHLVSETCDFLVNIPLAHNFDSLNVAQAATVLCYEFKRQLSVV